MSFFDIEGNWNIKMDAGSNTPAPFSLELSGGNMVYPQGGDFTGGSYYYRNNSIIMNLNDSNPNNNTLLFGLLSASGQLEGAFGNPDSLSAGIWAASKDTVEMHPVVGSGIQNFDLNGYTFEDDRTCSSCIYGATYNFSTPVGGNGLIRRVELVMRGSGQTLEGSYFTQKFHKDGPQFIGLDFSIPNFQLGFALGGVLEMDEGRMTIKGLAMNHTEMIYATWKAIER